MLLPLGTKGKVDRFPWITVAIILTNIILYLPRNSMGVDAYFDTVLPVVRNTAAGRYLLSTFLHINFWHIFGNMFFLWTFAPLLEDRMGRAKFFILYITGGIAASLANEAFFSIVWDIKTYGIGASGAVSAVMGAYIARFYFRKISFLPLLPYIGFYLLPLPFLYRIRLNAFLYVFFYMLLQIHYGLMQTKNPCVCIAYWAHIGGFAFGLGWALARGFIRKGRIEKYMEKVVENREKGFYARVEESARKVLELDTENLEAKHYLASTLSRYKPSQEGERLYRQAIKQALERKDHDRAVEIYLEYLPKYRGTFPADVMRILTREAAAREKYGLAAMGLELWLEQRPVDGARPQIVVSLAHLYAKRLNAPDMARSLLINFIIGKPPAEWERTAREMLMQIPAGRWKTPEYRAVRSALAVNTA